jgi:hypothetical protein
VEELVRPAPAVRPAIRIAEEAGQAGAGVHENPWSTL